MSSRRSRARQTELAFLTWGGARPGAGRKPTETRARVVHRARPAHDARHPIHVTVRLRKGLPTLRQSPVRRTVERALAFGNRRAGFRLVHFSLQSNHIHLLAEAGDRRALSRGMQALLVRVSRALNRSGIDSTPARWPRRGRCGRRSSTCCRTRDTTVWSSRGRIRTRRGAGSTAGSSGSTSPSGIPECRRGPGCSEPAGENTAASGSRSRRLGLAVAMRLSRGSTGSRSHASGLLRSVEPAASSRSGGSERSRMLSAGSSRNLDRVAFL